MKARLSMKRSILMALILSVGNLFGGEATFEWNRWNSTVGDPEKRGTISTPASNYETENVIILIIDGLRNEEAFDDSTHQFIPHIWNDLRPMGTIYTEFYTTSWTETTQGHLTLLTGNKMNVELTDGKTLDNFREHHPTIFEVYRKTFGLFSNETWIVSGKRHLSTTEYSLHPYWGAEYQANIVFDVGNDIETMRRFHHVVTEDQPSLVLINLRDVDEKAHGFFGATFEDYTDAIVLADSLAYEIWRYIQTDPYYQDRTTLIVTTDHSRFGGGHYKHHGGPDHHNRHIFFLALGPDIKQGLEVTTRGDLLDIAPTVGELLGFMMPFAKGRVLHEMIESFDAGNPGNLPGGMSIGEYRLTHSSGPSIYPSIDVNVDGLHVVWSERDSTADEEHRFVQYIHSPDSGFTWTPTTTITDSFTYYRDEGGLLFEDKGTPIYADIKSKDDGTLIVASNGYSIGYSDKGLNNKELLWGVNLLTRETGGGWIEQGFDNRGIVIASSPALAIGDPDEWVAWTEGIIGFSIGHSEEGVRILPRIPDSPSRWCGTPSIIWSNGFLHYVSEFRNKLIIYGKFDTNNSYWADASLLDRDPAASVGPRITEEDGTIYVVWAEYVGDQWQVKFRKSRDNGGNFDDTVQLSSSQTGAWYPDIAVEGTAVVVVWEDYRDGNGEIYSITSLDGGETWGSETRLTKADLFSAHPRIAGHGGEFYMVWQDYRDGNWEVYFRRLIPATS